MKQIIQNLKTGDTYLENVPALCPGPGQVLIRTTRTLQQHAPRLPNALYRFQPSEGRHAWREGKKDWLAQRRKEGQKKRHVSRRGAENTEKNIFFVSRKETLKSFTL